MLETSLLPPRYASPRRLARGGMGEVWLADDEELGRRVAIKVLDERFAGNVGVRRRFRREALAAARLSGHPHIVTIYDVGEWNDRPFIVMQHLSGGTLRDRAHGHAVEPDVAVRWVTAAAQALDAAHAEGIVHRDVKPANLIFDARGELHVADFGIARVLDATGGSTAAGSILGTAGYLSPEQARAEDATPASDVYALGVVAFELLCGSRPFARGSETAEALAHINAPVPTATTLRPALPAAVDDVLARAMAKHPGERHASAKGFATALREALGPVQRPPATTTATPAAATRMHAAPPAAPPRRRRLRWWLLAGVLALAAAAGVVAALLATRSDGRTATPPPPRVTVTRQVTAPSQTFTRTVVSTAVTTAPTRPPATSAAVASATPAVTGPHTLNDRAFALYRQGRYAEALPLLQAAAARLAGAGPADPYEGWTTFNLGATLLALGRCVEAVAPLQRSLVLQPGRGEVVGRLAQAQRCAAGPGDGRGPGKARGHKLKRGRTKER